MSLDEIMNDTFQDLLLHNHAGVGNETGTVSDYIVLRLVTADDIVIVPEEMIDLSEYNPEQRVEFAKAFAKELRGLADIGTFESVQEVPYGKKAIPSKNVYKIKFRANGSLDKFKTRTTIKGFHQKPMEDFFSTFSPTGNLTILRLILIIAVHEGLELWHSDCPQAFVQSDIDADILMMLPAGGYYKDDKGMWSKLVRLARSLYGTKQAPQLWNHELNHFLTFTCLMTRCDAEPCLYHYNDENGYMLVFDNVDDIIVTGKNTSKIENLRHSLKDRFGRDERYGKVTWDSLSSYYGININYNRADGVLSMDVKAKIDKIFKDHPILAKLNGNSNKPVETPVPVTYTKGTGGEVAHTDAGKPNPASMELLTYLQQNYRHFVGVLIFLSVSVRLDISEAVARLSRAMSNATLIDARLLRNTLRYLDTHRNLPLVYRRQGNAVEELLHEIDMQDPNIFIVNGAEDLDMLWMHDSNFASPKSQSGYCSLVYGCTLSWKSKLQPIVAPSVHAAELICCNFAADDAMWIRRVVLELPFVFNLPLNDTESVCVHALGIPSLTASEQQMLEDDYYYDADGKQRFVQNFLAEDAPTINKLLVTITPLPNERLTEDILAGSVLGRLVSKAKALFTSAASPSELEHYKKTHTKDGTLRRYTANVELPDEEKYKLGPTNLLGDNKGVTFTAKNPTTSSATRCLGTRWSRIREYVKQGYLRVSHIFTNQNLADFFTKPLPVKPFQRIRKQLMNY